MREKASFSVMAEIFHQMLWRHGSQVVRIWWSWEQAHHPATHWIVLNGSLSSTSWLCFVNSQLRPASGQLGFLHPVFIYNVWDQIVRIYPEMSLAGGDWSILRVCPREHQAIQPYAISPISVKLCQF